mmetsp:Transcript_27482/g.69911  ORF Transcript_27482/g.69911 Transcript_27482/m.69911 type:complete len:377 (-) Transcript_27482:685-1815(-)
MSNNGDTPSPLQLLDLRRNSTVPEGRCVYIQSGDPGDFDGYLIGVAGTHVERATSNLLFALVIPERRACPDRTEQDVNKHEEDFSEQVMHVSGRLFRILCPNAYIVRGPLNLRNIIPLKFVFSEPEKYGPLLTGRPSEGIYWRSVRDLAEVVARDDVSSVVLDMNGAVGYLRLLLDFCPCLGPKVKASGMPITVMAGILAEAETTTLRVPGRDPRSTMNALYDADAVRLMLDMATAHAIPLLFITNNVCNKLLRYDDAGEVARELGLQGLMLELCMAWYGPHLRGKCVPFDWVSFCAMLLHGRHPGLLVLEKRELYVGRSDASVLVLVDPKLPTTPTVEESLADTVLWGEVDSVADIDRDVMLALVRYVSSQATTQ